MGESRKTSPEGSIEGRSLTRGTTMAGKMASSWTQASSSRTSITFLILVASLQSSLAGGGHWNYLSEHGWVGECESGRSQSPIDIREAEHRSLPGWKFSGYGVDRMGQVKNNGHAVAFTLDGTSPQVSGGGLPDTFTFHSGHFHWGNASERGSEHTLGGQAFPLEMHLVHFNAKYGTLGDAVAHPDGLAVIGVFFSVTPRDNPALSPIFSSLASVSHHGSDAALSSSLSLASLLPSDPRMFYRYTGSLTTPGCNEVVTWTVMHEPQGVSQAQLAQLRQLHDSSGDLMGDNFRAVQPLHGRKVVASGLKAALVIQYEGANTQPKSEATESESVQWYHSMVPGWAVLLLCLAVGLNVAALVFLVMRGRGRRQGHHRVPTEEPK